MVVNIDNDRVFPPQLVHECLRRFGGGSIDVAHIYNNWCMGSDGTIAMRVEVFEKLHGYDEGLPYPSGCQDYDLVRPAKAMVGKERYCHVDERSIVGWSIHNSATNEKGNWVKIQNCNPSLKGKWGF